ncbi:RNA polymerase sigma-70 factor [Chitinophaga varians]|uniref:RNA polymerase sigma-70 factor n=1 Tax=Chitinophaga varians TaxID=2202339 RepID=A0A847S223_9BACT|nr:RNA polymerase sigma-70 factor [Chitinophaga varians]NLR68976.1 RNA polymerase sigma-70 factor [Chitinophaga varians]
MNIAGEVDEKALLALAAAGDETAFEALFMKYRQKLYSFMLQLNGSGPAAEDVVQEVFFRLWKERDKLAAIVHFNSYLFRMAQNQAINDFRKMARATLLPIEEASRPDTTHTSVSGEEVEFKALRERVHEIIESLPPQQRKVYLLNREQGLKHKEIASLLNISPSTVNKHLVQALQALRTGLGNHTDLLPVFFLLLTASENSPF